MKEIYLDNASTTPMAPDVVKVMTDEMAHDYGNASSAHASGRKARSIVEKARAVIAAAINAQPG